VNSEQLYAYWGGGFIHCRLEIDFRSTSAKIIGAAASQISETALSPLNCYGVSAVAVIKNDNQTSLELVFFVDRSGLASEFREGRGAKLAKGRSPNARRVEPHQPKVRNYS